MLKKYKDRLLKLATHLKEGKLGHKKFDFGVLNMDPQKDDLGEPYKCGTLGCAIGECPIIFPKDWEFSDIADGFGRFNPVLKTKVENVNMFASNSSFIGAEKFFGINSDEAHHLFSPDDQDTEKYGGKDLGDDATRKQVANNIMAFLKKKEKQE